MEPQYDEIKSALLNHGYDLDQSDIERICQRFGIIEATADNIDFLVMQLESHVQAMNAQKASQDAQNGSGVQQVVIERIKSQIVDQAMTEADQISSLIINQPMIVQNAVIDTVQQHKSYLRENPGKFPLLIHLGIVLGQQRIATTNAVVLVTAIALIFFGFFTMVLRNESNTTQNGTPARFQRIY